MKNKIFSMTAAVVVLLSFLLQVLPATADVMIMPIRVYFKDGDRMKVLSVINTSQTQALFRMTTSNKRQVQSGSVVDLLPEEKPAYDLADMLVYSPRQISLEGQGKQAVRISLRRPADLPDGEYRTYIRLMRMMGDETRSDAGRGRSKVVASLGFNIGFAVPVILRQGRYDAAAKFENITYLPPDLKEKTPRPKLKVQLSRSGKYSTMGSVEVYWTPPSGAEQKAGILNGVNIFPELTLRDAVVGLDTPLSGGVVRLVYRGTDADKGIIFDERTFPVQ